MKPKLGRGTDQTTFYFKEQEAGREVRNTIELHQALWGLLNIGKGPLAIEALNTGKSVWLYREGEGKTPPRHCHEPSAG